MRSYPAAALPAMALRASTSLQPPVHTKACTPTGLLYVPLLAAAQVNGLHLCLRGLCGKRGCENCPQGAVISSLTCMERHAVGSGAYWWLLALYLTSSCVCGGVVVVVVMFNVMVSSFCCI